MPDLIVLIENLCNTRTGDELRPADAAGRGNTALFQIVLNDVYLDSAFIKCFGKGNKQRVVPLGRPAVSALRAYLDDLRPSLARVADMPWVFISRGGKPLTRER